MLATRYRMKQTFKFSRLSQFKSVHHAVRIQKIRSLFFNKQMKQISTDHFGNVDLNEDLIQFNKLFHNNVEYSRSAVYIINLMNINEQPIFGQIVRIIKTYEKWWLLVDLLKTISYDEALSAWEIKSIDNYAILNSYRLEYYYKGLDIYEVNSSSYISFTARLTLFAKKRMFV
jgi:hypothetical protein